MSGLRRFFLHPFFVHPGERRPRLPFRLLVLLVAIVVWLAVAGLGVFVAGALSRRTLGASLVETLAFVFVVVVVPTVAVARLVDRRSLAELGVPLSGRGLLGIVWGTALGGALIAGVALTEELAGIATYEVVAPDPVELTLAVAAMVMVAIHEELLFRGYLLTNLAEAMGGPTERARVRGLVLATVITAVGFGLVHLGNPNTTVLGIANICLAGVWLAVPFVLRGELGASIGLHLGWNLAQAMLGMAVSGNDLGGAIATRTPIDGEPMLTGGEFGAEGSVLGLIALVLGTAVLIPLSWLTRDPVRAAAMGKLPERALAPG